MIMTLLCAMAWQRSLRECLRAIHELRRWTRLEASACFENDVNLNAAPCAHQFERRRNLFFSSLNLMVRATISL
jgi:hypothetical protein